ncbi:MULTISPECIES: hypothetical protein [Bradyrhizobium]|uniref:hypothetical protein n=1 Tax=Bradyrhizobium TaxID=374 RepID=UPI000480243E|nr:MULTISPECIES: hypothetical protein [Bradyrhizobium]
MSTCTVSPLDKIIDVIHATSLLAVLQNPEIATSGQMQGQTTRGCSGLFVRQGHEELLRVVREDNEKLNAI